MKKTMTEFGHFSEDGTEYVVTRPDTPRPWYNRIGNLKYGLVLSQTGGGYAVAGTSHHWRLNWYVPRYDESGRYLYLRDDATGAFWNAGYAPSRAPLDRFECRHGLGWTAWHARRDDIESEMTVFVPVQGDVELWSVQLTNRSRRRRRLSAFPFLEWTIEDADQTTDDLVYAASQESRYEKNTRSIVVSRRFPDRFEKRHGFMTADFTPNGWDGNRAAFTGRSGKLDAPQAVAEGACSNTPAYAEIAVSALHRALSLAPGQTATFTIMAGMTRTEGDRRRRIRRYLSPGAPALELARVRTHWQKLTRQHVIETPDAELNRYANFWLTKQVHELGATQSIRHINIGFRNRVQDAIGLIYFNPARARQVLVEAMPYQTDNGDCLLRYAKGAGADVGPKHVDTKIWLVLATCFYIKTTMDFSVLKETDCFWHSKRTANLKTRLAMILDKCWKDRGRHGLSLIGPGDWNDNLSLGKDGDGESVWMSEAVLWALEETATLMRHAGDLATAAQCRRRANEMKRIINRTAWDRDRYVMGYGSGERPVGSRRAPHVKAFLLPQAWAILSGAATPDRARLALATVARLMDSPYGPRLMDKPYARPDRDIGRITFLFQGMSENGPVYSHGAAFMLCAYGEAGRGETLYANLRKLLPFAHDPAVTLAEPYTISNLYRPAAIPRKHGATHRSWKTSTPNWVYRSISEGLFGVKPEYDELVFDPAMPRAWTRCRLLRTLRGRPFDITILNPDGCESGVREVRIDGTTIRGARIPFPSGRGPCVVQVVMGKPAP